MILIHLGTTPRSDWEILNRGISMAISRASRLAGTRAARNESPFFFPKSSPRNIHFRSE